ncbi:winged helix-turn-helix domain-containing protein [Streptomyces sp. NPDC051907]|uniref:winged helix-turn-helix domain-containing protein n=1 Tax=Streptomyces sp. NPDC051907 TaxID=3155284 RepID=UPI00344961C4
MLWEYLSAGGAARRRRRRDDELVAWLQANPDSEAPEVAVAIGRSIVRIHRHLTRLERQGRIRSAWIDGPVFNHTVYHPAPEARP